MPIPTAAASRARDVGLVVVSALLFSAKSVFVKLAYPYGVDALTLLTIRMAIALPCFAVIAIVEEVRHARRGGADTPAKIRVSVALLGAVGYWFAAYLDFAGLVDVTASLERVVLFAYPTFTVLLARVLFGHRIGARALVALVVSYAGIALALGGEVGASGPHAVRGAALVAFSAFVYAGYLVGGGRVIPRYGAARFVAHALTVACVAVILHFALTRPLAALLVPAPVLALAALMAIVSTVIPTLMLGVGIGRLGASEAAIAGSVGPISTLALGAIFLQERITATQAIGSALVLAGVTSLSVARRA